MSVEYLSTKYLRLLEYHQISRFCFSSSFLYNEGDKFLAAFVSKQYQFVLLVSHASRIDQYYFVLTLFCDIIE